MPLLYAVVARQNVVLARFSLTVGNFAEVTELILSRIDETKNKKMSYSSDSYMFHYICNENYGLRFLCISDEVFRRYEWIFKNILDEHFFVFNKKNHLHFSFFK